MAVHAADVLDAATRAASLEDAVAGCVWVVGTSSRRLDGVRRLAPREAAAELVVRSAQGPVALIFGDERNGLSNDEIRHCHALSAAPTSGAQPSINLAQAVLLYAYELRMAQLAADPPRAGTLPTAATTDDLRELREVLRETLDVGGFLRGPERHAVRDLLAPLVRARLTRREARLWLAALHTLRAGWGRGS
jgi:TrmH family RNA methyltransferase